MRQWILQNVQENRDFIISLKEVVSPYGSDALGKCN